jgi:hypothetical protein
MKTMTIPAPALCQLPLIDVLRPIAKTDTSKRPANFLVRIIATIWEAIVSRVPAGYEDETGFHYGTAEVSHPAIQTNRMLKRAPGKTRLKARSRVGRASDLNSGGQPVLQWDSSSRPPCRLSPESFSPETSPRHPAETVANKYAIRSRARNAAAVPARSRFLRLHRLMVVPTDSADPLTPGRRGPDWFTGRFSPGKSAGWRRRHWDPR